MYNLTNITDANNLVEMTVAVNNMSNGYLGIMMLACIFFVGFIAMRQYEKDILSTSVAAFAITNVIGVIMWAMQFITIGILAYPLIGMIGSIIALQIQK